MKALGKRRVETSWEAEADSHEAAASTLIYFVREENVAAHRAHQRPAIFRSSISSLFLHLCELRAEKVPRPWKVHITNCVNPSSCWTTTISVFYMRYTRHGASVRGLKA
jgi:hypothetical protein